MKLRTSQNNYNTDCREGREDREEKPLLLQFLAVIAPLGIFAIHFFQLQTSRGLPDDLYFPVTLKQR